MDLTDIEEDLRGGDGRCAALARLRDRSRGAPLAAFDHVRRVTGPEPPRRRKPLFGRDRDDTVTFRSRHALTCGVTVPAF
ncbi:hypothetical protein GCM10009592_31860 [Brachybacterium rhamnosum]